MSQPLAIQVHADAHVATDPNAVAQATVRIERALSRFADQITRVEAHINDTNGTKAGADDKRCALEVRLRGLDPVVVTHHAPSLELAVNGALDRAVRVLDKTVAKRRHPKGHDPFERITA